MSAQLPMERVFMLFQPSTGAFIYSCAPTKRALWKRVIDDETMGTGVTKQDLRDLGWRAVPVVLTPQGAVTANVCLVEIGYEIDMMLADGDTASSCHDFSDNYPVEEMARTAAAALINAIDNLEETHKKVLALKRHARRAAAVDDVAG